jgi:hypothetical protein
MAIHNSGLSVTDLKNTVLWIVMSCTLEKARTERATCYFCLADSSCLKKEAVMFFQNVMLALNCIALKSRRLYCLYLLP